MRLLWRRYFFFSKVQDFVVKQRIRNCLWKCASRSLFENGMPLASFKYALKKRFLLFHIDFVDCVFCCKIQSRTKRKINSINDFVSITIGLLILRCDEERKEKLLTCAMEIEVEGRSLSVIFYLYCTRNLS